MDRLTDLNNLSTFDLAFNLASGKYDEKQKFEALMVIKSRENQNQSNSSTNQENKEEKPSKTKPPLKGSKSEKIYLQLKAGKSAQEIYSTLNNKGTVVYYPEIYRIKRDYAL